MKNQFQIRSGLAGAVVTLAVSLVLSAVCSGLFVSGILPAGFMQAAAWVITFAACFLGALTAARQANVMPLPVALLAVGLYLAVIFVLRGLVFQSVGDRPYIVILLALLSCISGAVTGSGKGGKRRKK